ncbi:LCP family protein [Ruminiclostridium josui]|uniref:LCP family protein n=1 Tax=Ruminiclostridium josui TaxID=1499 RepID=UPI000B0EA87E|nr:LCP family protein [Ruminiclostridium josui]
MKSAKLSFLACLFSGIILFIIGSALLVNIRTSPPPKPNNDAVLPSGDSKKTIDVTDTYKNISDPLNFLVLIKEASGLHTDTIIIGNYEPVTNQISLLTVPRDTKPFGKSSLKINNVFSMGLNKYADLPKSQQKSKAIEYATQSISNLTNIPIDYYVYLEIDTIKEIVDMLGGVYFDVPADLRYVDPSQGLNINLKKDINSLMVTKQNNC